jgi:hypothetical protein
MYTAPRYLYVVASFRWLLTVQDQHTFGYHNPSWRTSFTDEQQLDFEGKYERCARVDKLSDIARACELKVAEEIKTLRTAIMELNQKEAKRG